MILIYDRVYKPQFPFPFTYIDQYDLQKFTLCSAEETKCLDELSLRIWLQRKNTTIKKSFVYLCVRALSNGSGEKSLTLGKGPKHHGTWRMGMT